MTDMDRAKAQQWIDEFGDPNSLDVRATIEKCVSEFNKQAQVRDELDRGLSRLLAGADIDPEMLNEANTAACLLTQYEEEEKERWKGFLEKTLDIHKMVQPVITEDGMVFDWDEIRPKGGPFANVSYMGTPRSEDNPLEKLWRAALEADVKSAFEEADTPIIVSAVQ